MAPTEEGRMEQLRSAISGFLKARAGTSPGLDAVSRGERGRLDVA